ncbi:alginate lyase family protein [Candidatus Kapabacteria bacterium]|nr:alginate lyase family protein [Candidatus Kapabacteria bacterium]
MPISSKLNKIIKTSPEVLIKKVFQKTYGKIGQKKSRKSDHEKSTFVNASSKLISKYFIIPIPNLDFLNKNKDYILKSANNSLNHNFKLLNAEFNEICYGMDCRGKDGKKYNSDIIDINHAIKKLPANSSNDVKTIRSLISSNYKPIDWQIDFISGYRWSESTWFKDIKYGYDLGVDVKIPWELGRMQDLPNLAFAYMISNNENEAGNYLTEFQDRVLDFYSMNPPRFGVQWKTAMDVGIRAVNILYTFQIFSSNGATFKPEFYSILENLLFQHLTHIHHNNEYSEGQRGNHYLTNVVSIILIASNFDQNNFILSLLDSYSNKFCYELHHQFLDDGGNFEGSIPYHLLSNELVLVLNNFFKLITEDSFLTQIKNKIFVKSNKSKISKIINFTRSNIHSGYIPKVGDHDSGRYFSIFENIHFYYNLFNQISKFDINKTDITKDNIYEMLVNTDNQIKIFNEFGVSTLKSNFYEITSCFLKLGQMGKGGHDHNDIGSFVLSVGGRPFIVDPGTYCYTSNWELRNKFRSTKYHNTLVVDNLEQSKINSNSLDDLFWLFSNNSDPFVVKSRENIIKVIYNSYIKPTIREFEFDNKSIIIRDKVNIDLSKSIHFHLHPNVKIDTSNGILLKRDNYSISLITKSNYTVDDYEYSPNYGIKVKAKKIIIDMPNSILVTELKLK